GRSAEPLCGFCPPHSASPLTLPRSMASARSFAFCPGSLAIRQRQRRDHSQHAAEQPPTQMPLDGHYVAMIRTSTKDSIRLTHHELNRILKSLHITGDSGARQGFSYSFCFGVLIICCLTGCLRGRSTKGKRLGLSGACLIVLESYPVALTASHSH